MFGFGLLKALWVTIKNFILPSRFNAYQYPDRKLDPVSLAQKEQKNFFLFILQSPIKVLKSLMGLISTKEYVPRNPRFRGQDFKWYIERCTGCASCAKYCPLGIIEIQTSSSHDRVTEGEKYNIDVFDIDIGRCMFCGLCVEACPYDALHMGSGFEEATDSRNNLIINVETLKSAPKKPSTWFRPQLEAQGYNPQKDKEVPWDEVGRHVTLNKTEQGNRWIRKS